MFHITPEGGCLGWGFNFYPWSERKYSIGFRFYRGYGKAILWARYAPHVGRLHLRFEEFRR